MKQKLAQILAFVGAADCVFIPLLFASSLQQPLFPQPGFYFVEILLFGLAGMGSVFKEKWLFIPWLVSGGLLVFNILGIWTVGLFLVPATLCFLGAGLLSANIESRSILRNLGYFGVGVLVQGALMQAWIYFS